VGRWLLVELAEDLAAHYQTRDGAWLLIKRVPGVVSIADMDIVSRELLDELLLVPAPANRIKPKKRKSGPAAA